MSEKLVTEGTYTFHFIARSESTSCVYTRELIWSLHVDVGIDSSQTNISTTITGTSRGGQFVGIVTIIPRDKYGNNLGAGRSSGVTISGNTGTTVTGPIIEQQAMALIQFQYHGTPHPVPRRHNNRSITGGPALSYRNNPASAIHLLYPAWEPAYFPQMRFPGECEHLDPKDDDSKSFPLWSIFLCM